MRKLTKKQKELISRLLTYSTMTITIIVTVVIVTFIMLGYRLDISNGQIEQYAFLQYSSIPAGATVIVDGVETNTKTPSKGSMKHGLHTVVMKKDGYETWTKTVNVKAGAIKWLNYVLLVPKDIKTESIADYAEVYSSSSSPDNKRMLIQFRSDSPSYNLVDIDSNTPKTTNLEISLNTYSEAYNSSIKHSFEVKSWDDAGRYVLIKHTYGDQYEWIMMDTQNVNLSKNISQIFDISISDIEFSGTSGSIYYVIEANDIRKLDLTAETISKALVNNVESMNVYETNIVAYVGLNSADSNRRTIGMYRDGDNNSYILKDLDVDKNVPVIVKTTHYYNQDYIVYSEGNNVKILGGTYPTNSIDSKTSMSEVESFEVEGNILNLSFSPNGEFILAQSNTSFISYDIEYQSLSTSNIDCKDVKTPLNWLDKNYLWSTCGGSLTIREFDGENMHTINSAVEGQTAVLTKNGKYIYSLNKTESGYRLLRAIIIIP